MNPKIYILYLILYFIQGKHKDLSFQKWEQILKTAFELQNRINIMALSLCGVISLRSEQKRITIAWHYKQEVDDLIVWDFSRDF